MLHILFLLNELLITSEHGFVFIHWYWRDDHIKITLGAKHDIQPTQDSVDYVKLVSFRTSLHDDVAWSCDAHSQQRQGVEPMLVQCEASFVDGGPTLNRQWFNVLCLLGYQITACQARVRGSFPALCIQVHTREQTFLPCPLVKIHYCGEFPWLRSRALDLRTRSVETRYPVSGWQCHLFLHVISSSPGGLPDSIYMYMVYVAKCSL